MAEQNEDLGSTILELDEKSLAELRENGFLLVAFPGGNAKLALAQLDKVFIAEYGETDVDLIEEQINLGKLCFCKHNSFNRYFPLGHYNAKGTQTPRIIVFNGYGNGSIDDIRIMDSSWSYNQGQRLEDKGELVDQTVTVSEGKISVNNNARASVTLSNLNALEINVQVASMAHAANTCIEIDNRNNNNPVTLTVKRGGAVLRHSASAGVSVAAGKFVQVTVVGDCWTMAEFEA